MGVKKKLCWSEIVSAFGELLQREPPPRIPRSIPCLGTCPTISKKKSVNSWSNWQPENRQSLGSLVSTLVEDYDALNFN